VTLRDTFERPEALDSGSIVLTGTAATDILDAVGFVLEEGRRGPRGTRPDSYDVPNCSSIVTGFILSTARQHHRMNALRIPAASVAGSVS
jgi:UDP-N-acetylglucosamine 2-epimerase